jgi:hypothetical protein
MITYCTLDIETIGTQREDIRQYIAKTVTHPAVMKKAETIAKWEAEDKPAAVEEAISRTGLDGAFGQVVVVGLAIGDDAPQAISSLSETYVLHGLNAALNKVPAKDWFSTCIVGFNVAAFDLRFLIQRYIVNKIKPHQIIQRAAQAKPWETDRVFDCMVQFAGIGNRISLDKTCTALDIESPKGSMDGSQVGKYVADGRLDEVAAYCLKDVAATREVFRRMTFQTVEVLDTEDLLF